MKLKSWANIGVIATIVINYFIVYRIALNMFVVDYGSAKEIMMVVILSIVMTFVASMHVAILNGEYLVLRIIVLNIILYCGDVLGEPHIILLLVDFMLPMFLSEFFPRPETEIRREM